VRRRQSDLHVGVHPHSSDTKKKKTPLHTHSTILSLLELDLHAWDSFRKLSTMGIQGSLAADIGQLSDLQSMYVESLTQLIITTSISLPALAVCHGEA
jgi:hypothetical protein